uniref:Uncharacterized protein n=1 Tax=Glossina pallidipes TaxID=7398 RepID=A0A1A9ZIT1_GLOPL
MSNNEEKESFIGCLGAWVHSLTKGWLYLSTYTVRMRIRYDINIRLIKEDESQCSLGKQSIQQKIREGSLRLETSAVKEHRKEHRQMFKVKDLKIKRDLKPKYLKR